MRKTLIVCLAGVVMTLSSVLTMSSWSQAQDASAPASDLAVQFKELLPEMDCADLTNNDQRQKQMQAQQTWQQICFGSYNNDVARAEINDMMVEALKQNLPAQTQAWLLRQFQWTGTTKEVPAIAACLSKNVTFVVDEAAAALAKIPGQEALTALKDAEANATGKNKAIFKGALMNRSEDLNVGTEIVMPLAIPYVTKATVDKWLDGYKALDEQLQVMTLAGLTVRGDKSYLPLVVDAIENGSDELKRAGILALEKLGTVKELPLLLNYPDRGLASRIASFIETDDFDSALIEALSNETDNGKYGMIAGILANRNVDISQTIFAKAKSANCANRLDLLRQAQKLTGKERINDFIDVLVLIPAGGQKDDAEKIIAAIIPGDATAVIAKMEQYPGTVLFGALGRIGGNAASQKLNEAVESSDSAIREAAIKALCNWPNAQVANDLFAISQNNKLNNGQRVAGLRAYIRVVSLPDDQIGIKASVVEKLAMLQKAFNAATRIDEKKLVLSRLSAVRDVKSLDFALQYVDDQTLAEDVYKAIADLAHHNNLRQPNKDKFGPAMDTVIQKSKDVNLVERVKRYRALM